ncbi:hypothetical protein RIF29_33611 [Crotalaria pallida]|uniref:RNase H type-1 domain-containing protein n=1 Tax=Crotalaria pallida TaxID=3830 RepID=A0AAN9EAU3_CROPI
MGTTMLNDFWDANHDVQPHNIEKSSPQVWKPPSNNWLMMNTDAACFANGKTGLGCIIRDSIGSIVTANCKLLETTHDPLVAEALAFRWGLQVALNNGAQNLVAYTDSLSLVKSLQHGGAPSSIHLITQDCLDLLTTFQYFDVSHVRKVANVPAHLLAKHSVVCQNDYWTMSVPNHILQAVMTDILNQ